jgi:hypothetical protein
VQPLKKSLLRAQHRGKGSTFRSIYNTESTNGSTIDYTELEEKDGEGRVDNALGDGAKDYGAQHTGNGSIFRTTHKKASTNGSTIDYTDLEE